MFMEKGELVEHGKPKLKEYEIFSLLRGMHTITRSSDGRRFKMMPYEAFSYTSHAFAEIRDDGSLSPSAMSIHELISTDWE